MLLDTYAWIGYFIGNSEGKKVEKILFDKDCYTSIVSLAEIIEWCLKRGLNPESYVDIVNKNSIIIFLDRLIAETAGKINFENKKTIKNWGMVDSFIYATARIYGIKVLTGDPHFKELDGVEMI